MHVCMCMFRIFPIYLLACFPHFPFLSFLFLPDTAQLLLLLPPGNLSYFLDICQGVQTPVTLRIRDGKACLYAYLLSCSLSLVLHFRTKQNKTKQNKTYTINRRLRFPSFRFGSRLPSPSPSWMASSSEAGDRSSR
jgi:hypothetical protein